MPFQNARSSVKSVLPEVALLSAGENQVVICGTSLVTLVAEVDVPANLVGHVLLWEQLTGNPVTLSTPNQISTTYNLTDPSDKSFRFWIDKGTAAEQFADVQIFHTPTSLTNFGAANTRSQEHSQAAVNVQTIAATAQAPAPAGVINPDVSGIPAIKIEWIPPSLPGLSGNLLRTELYRRDNHDNSPFLLEGTVLATAGQPNQFIGPAGYYIIRSVFDSGEISYDSTPREITEDSDIKRAVGLTIDGQFHIVDDIAQSMIRGNVTVLRFTIELFTVPADNIHFGGMQVGGASVQRFTNKIEDIGNDPVYFGGMSQTTAINIVRTSPSGIGGSV